MSRYANHSQEILYRNGRLIGFNAGYGYHSEHEHGYSGMEQEKPRRFIYRNKFNPFNDEIVETPELVRLIEFSDGIVWMTNDIWNYGELMKKTEEQRLAIRDRYVNNLDRKNDEDLHKSVGMEVTSPEVIALWNDSDFNLISTNEKSSDLIRRLYMEIQRKNVAISSDYSFLFKDRGLSFVFLDELSKDDFLAKQIVDYKEEMKAQFEIEYNEFLIDQGLEGLRGGSKYPIEFWNVQIHDLIQRENGKLMPEFYLELTDTSKDRENLDANTIRNIPRYMTGADIDFLVPIVQTHEYALFAQSHTKEEIGEYLNSRLQEYHMQQSAAKQKDYEVGENSLKTIAAGERKGSIERICSLLKGSIDKWLHPNRERDKSEGKGE